MLIVRALIISKRCGAAVATAEQPTRVGLVEITLLEDIDSPRSLLLTRRTGLFQPRHNEF